MTGKDADKHFLMHLVLYTAVVYGAGFYAGMWFYNHFIAQ